MPYRPHDGPPPPPSDPEMPFSEDLHFYSDLFHPFPESPSHILHSISHHDLPPTTKMRTLSLTDLTQQLPINVFSDFSPFHHNNGVFPQYSSDKAIPRTLRDGVFLREDDALLHHPSSLHVTDDIHREEGSMRVGRYSAEERKERIHRYRTKRNQRNFNKTIKYACRKTLADNRPRIRGRFARNENMEMKKTTTCSPPLCEEEEEEEFWKHKGVRGAFFNCYHGRFQFLKWPT